MADPGRLDELKRKFDENPRRYFAPLANEYRKAGEPDMAIELCRTYLPQQPSHMSGYIVYGQALHDARRDDEASAVFHQALSLDPENIIALRQLGDIARTGGDSAAAIQWYGKVLELDPRNEEIASFISALENPGSTPQRDWSRPERPVPPPVRPEPEHDTETVALEDLVAQPESRRVTPAAPMPAHEPVERFAEPEHHAAFEPALPPEEPPSPSPVEPALDEDAFEAVSWPEATPDEQRAVHENAPHPDEQADLVHHEFPVHEAPPAVEAHTEIPSEPEFHAEWPAVETHTEAEHTEAVHAGDTGDVPPHEPEPHEAELREPGPHDDAASELLRFSDFVPEEERPASMESESPVHVPDLMPPPHEEPVAMHADEGKQEPAGAQPSPFVTETIAELYVQQGLHGEALAIYRQLAVRRDDPALRQRIAELEQATPTEPASQAAASQAAESHDVANAPSGESVRAFFARIGAHRPTEHPHLAADEEGGLSSLFVPESVDDRDIAAAQSLAGAFTAPSGSAPHRG